MKSKIIILIICIAVFIISLLIRDIFAFIVGAIFLIFSVYDIFADDDKKKDK
jgi:hypothetical protein